VKPIQQTHADNTIAYYTHDFRVSTCSVLIKLHKTTKTVNHLAEPSARRHAVRCINHSRARQSSSCCKGHPSSQCELEMGRSSADAEVWPNVRLGSARQRETIRPKFRRTSFRVIGASNWRRFALAAGVNQIQYTYC